jgi:hypothetical protein
LNVTKWFLPKISTYKKCQKAFFIKKMLKRSMKTFPLLPCVTWCSHMLFRRSPSFLCCSNPILTINLKFFLKKKKSLKLIFWNFCVAILSSRKY